MRTLMRAGDRLRGALEGLAAATADPRTAGGPLDPGCTARAVPVDVGEAAGFVRLLDPRTGSWGLLPPAEWRLYQRLADGATVGPLRREAPDVDPWLRLLYRAGLLELDGDRYLDPAVLDEGSLAVRAPLFILVPTERCNLACRYCFAGSGPTRGERMSWPTARRALDLITRYPSDTLTVELAGGEPFAEKALLRQIVAWGRDAAQARGRRVRFLVQSNGTLIDPDTARWLRDEDVRVGLSLDGDPLSSDRTRTFADGRGAFDAIARGIDTLREAGTPFGLIVVVTRHNAPRLREILAFLGERGVTGVKLNPVFRLGRAQAAWDDLALTPEEYLAVHRDHLDDLATAEAPVVDDNATHILRNLASWVHPYRCMRSHCGAGEDFLTIAPSGEVFPCSRFRGDGGLRLGHVDALESLAGLVDAHPVMGALSRRRPAAIEACRSCTIRRLCEAGCSLDAWSETGRGDTPHPWCAYYKGIYEAAFAFVARSPDAVTRVAPDVEVHERLLGEVC